MKRSTAWKNLQTLCERFDEAVTTPERYPIPILRVWLYGSVLAEKAEPDNINLLVEVDSSAYCQIYRSTALSLQEILRNYRRALARYRAGMKMIHMDDLEIGQGEPGWWFQMHGWTVNTPYYLIWKHEMNWKDVLAAIQAAPHPYHPTVEAKRKRKNIESNGAKRVEPVMRIIRRKYHLRKHVRPGAIYVPLRTRVGFRLFITSDCCPVTLKPFLRNKRKIDLGSFERSYSCVGVVRWMWNEASENHLGKSVTGTKVTMIGPYIKINDARQWVIENVEKLFREVRMEPLPIMFD